jgi:hypothetical protein
MNKTSNFLRHGTQPNPTLSTVLLRLLTLFFFAFTSTGITQVRIFMYCTKATGFRWHHYTVLVSSPVRLPHQSRDLSLIGLDGKSLLYCIVPLK